VTSFNPVHKRWVKRLSTNQAPSGAKLLGEFVSHVGTPTRQQNMLR